MNMQIFFLLLFLFSACNTNEKDDRERCYIKCISSENASVNWYVYSLLTSWSPGNVEVVENDQPHLILSSDCLSDIKIVRDTLILQFFSYENNCMLFDTAEVKKIKLHIKIDSSGHAWNKGPIRLGRLITRHIDFHKLHHENTDSKHNDYRTDD